MHGLSGGMVERAAWRRGERGTPRANRDSGSPPGEQRHPQPQARPPKRSPRRGRMPPGCLIGCSGAWLTLAVKRVPSVRLGPLRSGPNQRGRPGRLRALHASRRARVAPSLPRAACDQEPPRQKRCAAHLRCLAVPRRPSRRAPRSPGRRPRHRHRHRPRRHLRAPCSLEGAPAQASTPKKKERGRGQPAMKPPARVPNVTLCDVRRSSPSAPPAGTRARVTRALRPPTNRALWALSSCEPRVKQNLKMGPPY